MKHLPLHPLPPQLTRQEIYPFIADFYRKGALSLCQADKGEYISDASSDEQGHHIIYILQGGMQIFSFSRNGRRILLDEVGAGSFCGHISKLRGFNFNSTIVAGCYSQYLSFPQEVFDQLMEQKEFALLFYQGTSNRTYAMFRKMLGLNLLSLEENTAFYLLSHQNTLDQLTLDTISEEIGMSRRSLCYILKRWRNAGVVEKARHGYRIRNQNFLLELSDDIRHFYHAPLPAL